MRYSRSNVGCGEAVGNRILKPLQLTNHHHRISPVNPRPRNPPEPCVYFASLLLCVRPGLTPWCISARVSLVQCPPATPTSTTKRHYQPTKKNPGQARITIKTTFSKSKHRGAVENPMSVTTFSHFHQALLPAGTLPQRVRSIYNYAPKQT